MVKMVATGDVVSTPTRLIDVLPGLSRAGLATIIVGEVMRRFKGTGAHFRVLSALICHAGTHGDRVWASLKRLASLASLPDDAVSTKTASRAIAAWCKKLGIRKITDPKELLEGPGEHDYIVAGHEKKGEGPVSHYDIAALRKFVPSEFLTLWDAFFEGRTITVQTAAPELPRVVSFEVAASLPSVPRKPKGTLIDQEPVLPLEEVPSDPYRTILSVSSNPSQEDDGKDLFDDLPERNERSVPIPETTPFPEPEAVLPPSPASPFILSTLHEDKPPAEASVTPSVLCNVNNIENAENTPKADTHTPTKSRIFNGTILSDISNKEETAKASKHDESQSKQTPEVKPSPRPKRPPAHLSPLWPLLTNEREKGGRGFWPAGAAFLILNFEEAFIRQMVASAVFEEERSGVLRDPGWITNACKNFSGHWSPLFLKHWRKMERQRAAEQAEAAQGGNAAARTVYKAPRPEEAQKPVVMTEIEGLPEPLRMVWPEFLDQMQKRVSVPTFGTHLRQITGAEITGDTLTLLVGTAFTLTWLEKRQSRAMAEVFTSLLGRSITIRFRVQSDARK